MKTCKKCNLEKSLDAFNKRGEGYQPWCRNCQSGAHKEYYEENQTARKEQIRFRKNAQREINRAYVVDYLQQHPCVDCGDSRLLVLQFDHVHGQKAGDVGNMVGQGYKLSTVIAEIEKCEVRCANCHTIVTANRAGWTWKA